MSGELVTMSHREIDRLAIIEKVETKQLSQIQAAKTLRLSTRQVRNLQQHYRQSGAQGLVSKRRGQPSNRQIDPVVVNRAIELIKGHYADFGPVLVSEKLKERHGLSFSKETIRQWMIQHGLWQAKRSKARPIHQTRARRAQRGELIQIDGSPHDWFEGRAPECCLIVFVDDATSEIMMLHFAAVESTQAYFDTTLKYLQTHGRPLSYYSDRHNIFRVNIKEARLGNGQTQLSRALKTLDIDLICANSPQAKGRVERMNKTLQDRLVKELRLRQISSIDQANDFLPEFILAYNQRFAKQPACAMDAHRRSLPDIETLKFILAHQEYRTVSKNLEIRYKNVCYQIQTKTPRYTLRHAKITVCHQHGNISLVYKGEKLPYKTIDLNNQPRQILSKKQVLLAKKTTPYKPKPDHPWRNQLLSKNKNKHAQLLSTSIS